MNSKKSIGIVICLVLMGASFYGGTVYQKGQTPMRTFGNGQFTGAGRGDAGGRGGAGFTAGEIIAKDATSITVKMMDGSTKNVLVSNTTTVGKSTSGTLTDLVVGETVTVQGSANSDGSVTAQMVQIRPAGFGTTSPQR